MGRSNRQTYLINPSFQYRVIGYALFIAVSMTLVFYIANLFFFYKIMGIANHLQLPPEHPFFNFIAEQKLYMNTIFGITAAVSILLIGLFGMFWSHRVAGPIYKVQLHMQKIIDDKVFSRITFRKGDSFMELADSINAAFEALYGEKLKK